MQFDEMGLKTGKTLFLLLGTACDYQTNFGSVLDRLGERYHLVCVNYDGRIGGAIGSSLGSSFVGQLIQRPKVHLDHGIFGSPDLDQSGKLSAWLQSKLVVPLLTSFTAKEMCVLEHKCDLLH